MSPELQEWLALAIVIGVAGAALWRHRTNKKSKGCSACAVAQCRPAGGGQRLAVGVNTDPYHPQLSRPED